MNYELFRVINDLAGRWGAVDQTMRLAATVLIYPLFAAAGVAILRALWQRRFRRIIDVGLTLTFAYGMAALLHHLSRQRRPFQTHVVHQLIPHDPGVSMPSDHAVAALTVGLAVFVFLSRRVGAALLVVAMVIGFSRVWAGVHYPGDILAAAVIAVLATVEVWVFERRVSDLRPRAALAGAAGPRPPR
ncbi:phosphatase PAP2 family protein [Mangrovihabitans endophyticus]|uniref:phosphatase PAP2 family protein n=1 Tax=Mangrovihabitans endophyticus TaxID=1751298 RepID=UPI00166654A8|nr:phosphatase PAP2 family protein [Mangrovihabitans endophyticus]